jgi:hypothetical protein
MAQWHAFGPFFQHGALVTAPRLYHYAAGTTIDQLCWMDRAKTITAPQPLIGDANGLVWAYFEGNYKLIVTTADGLVLAVWDQVVIAEGGLSQEGSIIAGEIELMPGQTATLPSIHVPGAVVGRRVDVRPPVPVPNVSLYGYVSAPDIVTVQLFAALTGPSGFSPFPGMSIPANSGVFGPSITVPGAAVGDAVIAYPPYPLAGVLITAYVNNVSEVHVRLYNSTSGTLYFPNADWYFVVLKRSAIVIPAGTWHVVVSAL